jgi:metallo-beta-lactamase class B
MFASLALAAAAALQQIVIPFGKPPPFERVVAPIHIAGPAFAKACKGSKDPDNWETAAPPVRIHGNTYLVGTCGISALLITGDAGHILIDGGTEGGADLIAANIRRLGFKLTDIKYLLHSHEHFDHVAGIARLQQLTGGELIASPAAAAVFRTGVPGAGDPQVGMHPPFPAARVDRMIEDGGEVRLGNLMLTAVSTPGHSPGALTWHWGSCDGGVCRRMVYADSLSPISRKEYRFSSHPAYLASYRAGLEKLASLDCDILLTPHSSSSRMVERLGGSEPLNDRDACRNYSAAITKRLDERLASETAAK